MRVRAGLVSAVYKKALILSCGERGRASGDIVNLMSVDTTRLQDFCTYGLIAISGPLQVRVSIAPLSCLCPVYSLFVCELIDGLLARCVLV